MKIPTEAEIRQLAINAATADSTRETLLALRAELERLGRLRPATDEDLAEIRALVAAAGADDDSIIGGNAQFMGSVLARLAAAERERDEAQRQAKRLHDAEADAEYQRARAEVLMKALSMAARYAEPGCFWLSEQREIAHIALAMPADRPADWKPEV